LSCIQEKMQQLEHVHVVDFGDSTGSFIPERPRVRLQDQAEGFKRCTLPKHSFNLKR
jgi:hypothetical protein